MVVSVVTSEVADSVANVPVRSIVSTAILSDKVVEVTSCCGEVPVRSIVSTLVPLLKINPKSDKVDPVVEEFTNVVGEEVVDGDPWFELIGPIKSGITILGIVLVLEPGVDVLDTDFVVVDFRVFTLVVVDVVLGFVVVSVLGRSNSNNDSLLVVISFGL